MQFDQISLTATLARQFKGKRMLAHARLSNDAYCDFVVVLMTVMVMAEWHFVVGFVVFVVVVVDARNQIMIHGRGM